MTVLRKTSVYSIEVALADGTFLDQMIARLPSSAQLAASGFNGHGSVFVRVRVANDYEAGRAALAACDGREFTLATGYGVNRREVPSRPFPGRCWNCRGERLVVQPDAGMQDVTDEVVCLDCSEVQATD